MNYFLFKRKSRKPYYRVGKPKKRKIMKKIKILLSLCLLGANLQSQNSYGITEYPHTNSFLTSGTLTSANPGFLMAGAQMTNATGSFNFCIDRTGKGGAFTSATYEFQKEYTFTYDNNCLQNYSTIYNCAGVTVIESGLANAPYAVVGAFDYGCFFATLDGSGAIVNQAFYKFGTQAASASKPLITPASVGGFHIVGSYDGDIYMILVNSSGVIQSTNTWDGQNDYFTPRAIIESPYTNNYLTIVGIANSATTADDGMFIQILPPYTSLATNSRYYMTSGSSSREFFTSIQVASSTTGGNGFIIGGYADSPTSGFNGKAWMLKTNTTGTPIWSAIIEGSITQNTGKLFAVAERYNSANAYEYYGTSATTSGIGLYKLDDTGLAFSVNNAGATDESVFNTGSNSVTSPDQITFYNSGTSYDVGLHIYGNREASTAGNHYFVEAYFSGHAGCNNPTQISQVDATLPSQAGFSPATGNAVQTCAGIISSANTTAYNVICGLNSSIAGASNARPMTTNMIKYNSENSFVISPNPTSGKIKIDVIESDNSEITLWNLKGELIIKMNPKVKEITLNLQDYHLSEGVYYLKAKNDFKIITEKIIYKP